MSPFTSLGRRSDTISEFESDPTFYWSAPSKQKLSTTKPFLKAQRYGNGFVELVWKATDKQNRCFIVGVKFCEFAQGADEDTDEVGEDQTVPLATTKKPSSAGLSFQIAPEPGSNQKPTVLVAASCSLHQMESQAIIHTRSTSGCREEETTILSRRSHPSRWPFSRYRC